MKKITKSNTGTNTSYQVSGQKRLIVLFTFLCIYGINGFSQNPATMQIHKSDHSIITVKLSEVDSITFTSCEQVFKCGDTLVDSRDKKSYSTVLIGTQCWMRQNLNIGKFAISNTTGGYNHSDVSDNKIIEKYCYNNDTNNCKIYGGLYDWDEMMDYLFTQGAQGICPTGWHIPADSEYYKLEHFLDPSINNPNSSGNRGTNGGTSLKLGGTGFDALFSGWRNIDGNFGNQGTHCKIWTSTLFDSLNAWSVGVYDANAFVGRFSNGKKYGFSVRCLKD